MSDTSDILRNRCIRLAYRSQPEYLQREIDNIVWQLETGMKKRNSKKMMFGPVSAMELTYALARLVYRRE